MNEQSEEVEKARSRLVEKEKDEAIAGGGGGGAEEKWISGDREVTCYVVRG